MAREPIIGASREIIGYRVHMSEAVDEMSELGRSLTADEIDTLTHGQPAFVRVGPASFEAGLPPVLTPHRVVLELPAETESREDARKAFERLRQLGYRIAIDDFTYDSPAAGLAGSVDFLKVAIPDAADADARARTFRQFASGPAALIATGINTEKQRDEAAADGFTRFQGFHAGRPRSGQPRHVSSRQLASLQLLGALNRPNLTLDQLEEIVKHDAALCHQLLRTINSAAHGLPRTVTSIRDALMLLGRDMVRRWASMWAVAAVNANAHHEVVTMATVRARVCELLALSARDEELAGESFLAGMCSLLDAMLGQPLHIVLADLPLTPQVRGALSGQENLVGYILDTAVAYERGRFDVCETLAARARVNPAVIPGAFLEALRWTREFSAPPPPRRD